MNRLLEMAAAKQIKVPIKGKVLSLRLEKDHKDKTSWLGSQACAFPDNFSVTLILVKEENQSETLNPLVFLVQPLSNQVSRNMKEKYGVI